MLILILSCSKWQVQKLLNAGCNILIDVVMVPTYFEAWMCEPVLWFCVQGQGVCCRGSGGEGLAGAVCVLCSWQLVT